MAILKQYYKIVSIFLYTLLISGCAYHIPTLHERQRTANNIIDNSIISRTIQTKYFKQFVYLSSLKKCESKYTNIYIEGDGLSWISSDTISENPTPLNPVSVKLFSQDISECKVYLARPCQYTNDKKCTNKYWTSHRFSNDILMSMKTVIDILKKEYKFNKINIIGYSGGGAIATLLSAKRDDINYLLTVAGNLDIDYWVKKHYITPLYGSLNPADFSDKLKYIKQYHLIGEDDNIIDKSVFESYLKNFKNRKSIQHKIFKNYTHSCCWDTNWNEIINSVF